VAEGARLESVYTLTGIGGSNPSLSARIFVIKHLDPRSWREGCQQVGTAMLAVQRLVRTVS
jgi:hypothetical protein